MKTWKEKNGTWKDKEKTDARTVGGRRNRGSGNRWYNPGDSRSSKYLVESKFTTKESYSLNRRKLQKLYNESLLVYKTPLFMVKIKDTEVVLMFREDFEKLIQ